MAYNYDKDTCDRCGITKEKAKSKPMPTGSSNYNYATTTSFQLGYDGSVLCAWCSKEKQLEQLFAAMDAREGKG